MIIDKQGEENPQELENQAPEEQTKPAEEVQGKEGQTPEGAADNTAKEPEKKEEDKASVAKETVVPDVPEIIEKVISINRITKVTKGGKKLSFSALVVVGDTKGNVGYSLKKAREVAMAIRKAMAFAKSNMIAVPLRGTTITHEIIGECGGARVLLKPAAEGTGVIASGPVRAVCDGAGIHNILTKCHRSNNPINVVKATIDGLSRLKCVEEKQERESTELEESKQ